MFSDRKKADRLFTPPRLVVPETQPTEDATEEETQLPREQPPVWTDQTEGNTERQADSNSEGKTQLPKDQPPFIPATSDTSNQETAKDFVPVSSIFLEERTSEDEDNSKTATSSDNEDNVPVRVLIQRQKQNTGQTPTKSLRDSRGDMVVGEAAVGVRIAKVFQDLGMFKGIVDRVDREMLYHVLYDDGDEEELSTYEYVLACQLNKTLETNNGEAFWKRNGKTTGGI